MGRRLLVFLLMLASTATVAASDFRSVEVPAAILYDAPSQMAKRLYLIRERTPVEVIVKLEGWLKVRDAEGSLAWIEARLLGERRSLIVTAPLVQLRQAAQAEAATVAQLEKWVLVDLLEPPVGGWVRVRHRDGATGFVRMNEVWGL